VLTNRGRDLRLCHFIDSFYTDDAPAQPGAFETPLQCVFRFTGTKYQNGLRITNGRNDSIVEKVEMSRKSSLAAVVRG